MITYVSEVPYVSCKTGEINFFKKFPARRALMELGENDSKLNLRMAENLNLLTISASNFKKKWNFDTMNMKPLSGRFIWTPVTAQPDKKTDRNLQKITDKKNLENTAVQHIEKETTCSRIPKLVDQNIVPLSTKEKVGTCLTLPRKELRTTSSGTPSTGKESSIINAGSTCSSISSCNLSCSKLTSLRQTKITDFGRQRKRKLSTSKTEDELIVSPSKKVHIESPTTETAISQE